MGIPKFSTLIIGLVWVSFFATIFAGFLANLSSNYGVDATNINFTIYNKLAELDSQTEELKETAISFQTKSGVTDLIGAYFTNGYQTARTAATSINVFFSMTNAALGSKGLNIPVLKYLETSIIITMLIFLVIGVLLSAILKKDV